jgi:hypothetical protein
MAFVLLTTEPWRLFLCTAAYLIFGSWLNYNRYGARGWDLLPHGDTIRDIPYLMKDWGRRVVNTVQGPGSRGGYSAVWSRESWISHLYLFIASFDSLAGGIYVFRYRFSTYDIIFQACSSRQVFIFLVCSFLSFSFHFFFFFHFLVCMLSTTVLHLQMLPTTVLFCSR